VGLEGAEPKSQSGGEGTAQMEAQEKNQAEQGEERGLAHGYADEARGEGKAQPVCVTARRAVKLVDEPDREQEAGEEEEGPEDAGDAEAKIAKGQGQGQCPWRVAHNENGTGVEPLGVLEDGDGVAIVWIDVLRQQAAGGPIGDEIAGGAKLACDGNGAYIKDGDSECEPGDSGDGKLGEILRGRRVITRRGLHWGLVVLRRGVARHGGYSTVGFAAKRVGTRDRSGSVRCKKRAGALGRREGEPIRK